jgi:Kef-type K+ transport system membrane component KefB
MDNSIFAQLSFVLGVGAVVALFMKWLKQPLIMGYILTGVLVGPSALNIVHAKDAFESFSEIGITLLLFIIGLGMNAGVIKSLGRVSVITASIILLLVGFSGHLAALALGFNNTTAIILGIALFFSSTIIILKALSDSRELSRLYGQIAIGVILVDDVVATIALVVVAALGTSGALNIESFAILGLKAFLLGLSLYIVGSKIMPHLGKFFASSQELLFLFSIAWGLIIATVFHEAGFSYEVGALFAGVSLAGLPYATEMAAKLKPLRDFFIVLFFVTLGETFTFDAMQQSLVPALVLSAIVMLGKPIFVMSSLGFLGYTRLTSFKAAIHLSQISEFSIILVIFAASTGLIQQSAVSVITLVALITIGISTYLMKYDDELFRFMERHLQIFERKNIKERKQRHALYPIILFGYHKGGHEFMRVFRDMRQRYLVVDYDPDIIEHLEGQGIRHAYGDATDEEFLEEINAGKAQLVVSMMTDIASNKVLLRYINRFEPRTTFICHANDYDEAAELYRHGASYVMLPHFIGSERISSYIKQHGFNPKAFDTYREKHIITIGKKALKIS